MAADQPLTAGKKGSAPITLVANTVYEVTFADDGPSIQVINPASNTADVWYSNDGTTPTVGGTNTYLVPAGMVDEREPANLGGSAPNDIKLISSGTPAGVRVQRGN